MIEIGLEEEKPQIEGIQENFEEGYVKKKQRKKEEKRKNEMEGECPINSKKGERRTQQMPKVNTKKNQVSCLLVCLR